jgi:hypothetical protein
MEITISWADCQGGSVRNVEIEKRVAVLEEELATLRRKVEVAPNAWWEKIAGTFEKDPVYEQAMGLGREYRQSLRPNKPPRKRK